MKYRMKISSIPTEGSSAESKHIKFLDGIKDLREPWNLTPIRNSDWNDFGDKLSVQFNLDGIVSKKSKGYINYRFRKVLRNNSSHDDFIELFFNTQDVDYKYLIKEVLPCYIRSFNAYKAIVGHEEFMYTDFNKSRHVNERETILRYYAVMYLSDFFCESVFGNKIRDFLDKIETIVESINHFNNGILLIFNENPIGYNEINQIGDTLKDLFKK